MDHTDVENDASVENDTDGEDFDLQDIDIEDVGQGRPLLWGHGLTSSRAAETRRGLFNWSELTGLRLIRWDAPGHGESPPVASEEDTRWERLGRIMLAVGAGLGLDRFVAGGASMGAATTLWAAVMAPERIDALLLVIPPTAWETRSAQAGLYRSQAELLDGQGTGAWLDQAERAPLPALFVPFADEIRQARRQSLADADPVSMARVLRGAAASDLPPRSRLSALTMPTLILAWAGDPAHPLSTAEALADTLPSATLRIANDVSEVLAWRAAVAEFLL